jgi:DNA-binding winged helix-turn-helix (wHTH) protein
MPPQSPPDSVQRRPEPAVYRVADLSVDTGRVSVSRDGQPLAVSGLSFDLLVALIAAAPRVVSPDELMDRVWSGLVVGPETVSQRIKLLRDALGDDPKHPRYVAGVRGRGYRLVPDAVRVVAEADAAPPAANTPLPAGRRPRWQAALPAAGLAAIVGLGSWWLLARDEAVVAPPDATTSPPPAQSVAVLAFEDRGGSPACQASP